jgi:type IV pilus assembly protein PilC
LNFTARGFDKSGAPIVETVEAADRAEAADRLRRKGIFVTELAEGGVSAAAVARTGKGGARVSRGKQLTFLATFTRQLAVLVSTGTPLVEAVTSIEKQARPGPWKDVLKDVRTRVEEGAQLSDAMAMHPKWFDAVCRSLIAAGEHGGGMVAMLERLALLTRQQQKTRRMLVGSMVYPCLLICVSIGVVTTMIGFVLPRFEGLFQTLGTPLPPLTKVLMDLSAAVRENWMWLVGALVACGVGIPMWLKSAVGKRNVDTFLVRAPQISKVVKGFATARIARLMGVLLEGKVGVLDALELIGQSTLNLHYAALVKRAQDAVTRGESMTNVFADPALISPAVTDAMRSGERSGQMGSVLSTLADYLDEDNEAALKSITGLIEPLILLGLGLVVGSMAISMFLPLFDLAAAGPNAGGGAP